MVVWSLRIGMFYSRFPYISPNGHDTLDVCHLFTTVFLALMPVQLSSPVTCEFTFLGCYCSMWKSENYYDLGRGRCGQR